jgi:hypothetical protein
VLLFLQLTQSSGRPIGRFKSLKIYRIHASLVVWLASSSMPAGCWNIWHFTFLML